MSSIIYRLSAAIGCAAIFAAGTAFAEPSALVEDISSDRDDVQLFDYLEPGQEIMLGAGETIVIGYLFSCIQETITGGKITIGEDESVVTGGTRDTADVDCDGGPVVAQVGAEQEAGAAATFRDTQQERSSPNALIFGLSPLVRLNAPASGNHRVKRLGRNRKSERRVSAPQGLVVDMAKAGVKLTRGGTYRITADDRALVFKVSRLAEDGGVPPVSRLLPL